jgi:tripartite ATP-independent transporter DctP family solute receptor
LVEEDMAYKFSRFAKPLLLAASLTIAGAAQSQTVLKFGFGLQVEAHYGVGAVYMQKAVAERMGGRYKIELFPNFQLGGEREMTEGAQLGTIDLVTTSTGPVGNFVPDTLITDIPFLFRDYAHARGVLDGPIGQGILDKCTAKGLICLAWAENGFRHMTNNRREVATPADAKGLKVRTMENPVHMQAFRTLGVLPTPMAFPEVFGALQQGTVDGQENPIGVIVSAKLNQVQKHLTLTGHLYSPAMVLMSPAAFNKMSADDRKLMVQIAKEGAQVTRKRVEELERQGIESLKAAGMQIRVLSNDEKAAFQTALAPAYTEFAKRFGQASIDAIRNAK